jgi:hypothetical protein
MSPKNAYLGLGVAGTVLAWAAFLPFVAVHGLDLGLFIDQLFATPVSAFFGWDVIVSSFALWAFVFFEGRRLGMKHLWAPIVANVAVGVSLGLPLFLYMREVHRGAKREGSPQPVART